MKDKFGVVEKHFEYKGHDCICVFSHMGYRCGYVSVDEVKDYSNFDIDCHCGLSFGAREVYSYYNPKKSITLVLIAVIFVTEMIMILRCYMDL